jgi:hypothetical protein
MEKIIAKVDPYQATIGKKSPTGQVNVFTNFDPITNTLILRQISVCTAVDAVTNAANYGDGTGGLAIKLKADVDEYFLQRCFEQIFNDLVHTY